MNKDYIDIVFDGPPSHESGRFVEVENSDGRSINFGEWVKREDGYWALRISKDERISELEAHNALLVAVAEGVENNSYIDDYGDKMLEVHHVSPLLDAARKGGAIR